MLHKMPFAAIKLKSTAMYKLHQTSKTRRCLMSHFHGMFSFFLEISLSNEQSIRKHRMLNTEVNEPRDPLSRCWLSIRRTIFLRWGRWWKPEMNRRWRDVRCEWWLWHHPFGHRGLAMTRHSNNIVVLNMGSLGPKDVPIGVLCRNLVVPDEVPWCPQRHGRHVWRGI